RLGTVLDMHGSRDEIAANIATIRAGIEQACHEVGRTPHEVLLVAAAKTLPAEVVRWAVEFGVTDIGENYVKELRQIHDDVPGARWHYIGALQTNTAHHVAALADVVQTVAGLRATERLARRATEHGRTIDVLIEVDLTRERSGVAPDETVAFADRVAAMEGLTLRGLMTIPPLEHDAGSARPWFRELRALLDRVRDNHPDVVDLSMGMSLDYRAAVEEGATMVRIGTALFGPRTP
ncbi:MAG TPA: YggS family pyridoxal phosphate-dependent enzyme, partial [Actinomycetota bacterium]